MNPIALLTNPVVMSLLLKLIAMFQDNKIDGNEINDLIFDALRAAGVELRNKKYDVFVEMDGDVHIILKKEALDAIKFNV